MIRSLERVEIFAEDEVAFFEYIFCGVAHDVFLVLRAHQVAEAPGVSYEFLPVVQAEVASVSQVDVR